MLLIDIINAVRQDLFDPASPTNRWSTSDLERAIDKAVIRYSQCSPFIAYADMSAQPYQRTYAYPSTWNSAYPVWWLERIVYPLQVPASFFAPPATAMTANLTGGSELGIGNYRYAITFLTPGGETTPSPLTLITTTSGNQRVSLSSLPTSTGSPQVYGGVMNMIIGRVLYRSQVNTTTLYRLTTLQDTSTTTYLDTSADSALNGQPQAPSLNTSGVTLWPPRIREFAEHSPLLDGASSLAASGNLGMQGTAGTGLGIGASSFTLKLVDSELPQDTTSIMRVFYATKHQLDNTGSTLPETHRDLIVLGSCAYAMEAYQVPTNDNFLFQDGEVHDRLDDTHIPASWRTTAQAKMAQFEARLQHIQQQRQFLYGTRIQWGDIPARWSRL